jgi:hemoglobin/transferrin/lactoferrin receptor protein
MKRSPALLVLFLLIPFSGSTQIITVLEKTSLRPIPGLHITGFSGKFQTTTDAKGRADLSAADSSESVRISGLGFDEKLISINALRAGRQYRILLTEKSLLLNQIVISASRFEEKKEDAPMQIEVIKAQDVERMNQPTTAEMLMQTGQLFVQKSQLGGGSPVLRGFEASRVLLVIDGVRLNNAIYRTGHLQNVLRVDQNLLERAEVVFGPGSVVYGSDALGGVVHLFTKEPKLAESRKKIKPSGSAFLRYGSAMHEITGHADISLGTEKFGSLTSVTFSRFGDLMQGNIRRPELGNTWDCTFSVSRINGRDSIVPNKNTNLQKGSGYFQYDLLQKFLIKGKRNIKHGINLQYSASSNVNRYDRLSESDESGKPRFAAWYYGPEKRGLASYSLQFGRSRLAEKGKLTLAYQWIEESRNTRRLDSPWLTERRERVHVASVLLDLSEQIGKHEIRYGLEGAFNQVYSAAKIRQVDEGTTTSASTRYPDGGSRYFSAAAYVSHTWEINSRWILATGARLNYVGLRALFTDTSFFAFPFSTARQNHFSANGSLGLIFQPGKGWRIALSGASGFRAPNVDDLGKVFDSQPGNLIVPNPSIKPEYTVNTDLNISKTVGNILRLEAIGFFTHLFNFISVQPFQINGEDSLLYEGEMSKVSANLNTGSGFVTGATFRALADLHPNFSLDGTLTYTYGRLRQENGFIPLDHIPPLFGRISAHLKFKKIHGEFFTLFNGRKYLKDYSPNGEDNLPYATPNGMPGWFTLNIRAGYTPIPALQIQVALENISDVRYRTFSSGISAPGRNLILSLRTRF